LNAISAEQREGCIALTKALLAQVEEPQGMPEKPLEVEFGIMSGI
jgi:hypothetical protein